MRQGTLMVSACSNVFFDDWLDLLDSVERLGLRAEFECGLLDLGLTDEQIDIVRDRGVRRVKAEWPFEPPAHRRELFRIVEGGRPFMPLYFPDYEYYLWMDADTWAQTPAFWHRLRDGARAHQVSIPMEVHESYAPMSWRLYRWLAGNTWLGTGNPLTALRAALGPLTNHGIFAMRGDHPMWREWQDLITAMVARANKITAFDQLALAVLLYDRKRPIDQVHAEYNWNCQRALPHWDEERGLFVTPDADHRVLHALHLTNFTRGRVFEFPTVRGGRLRGTTHPPGGRLDRRTLGLGQPAGEPPGSPASTRPAGGMTAPRHADADATHAL